jgi:mannose-6-phosphate isomerase-like protein (cupin superfamily)
MRAWYPARMTPTRPYAFAALCAAFFFAGTVAAAAQQATPTASTGSRIQHDADVAVEQPGPHDGTGMTTAYPFFSDLQDLKFFFRKRALHKGASIGLHRQAEDEIYYVLSGMGELTLDGTIIPVGPGTAMLTRPGSSHTLRQTGEGDLVILISYLNQQAMGATR